MAEDILAAVPAPLMHTPHAFRQKYRVLQEAFRTVRQRFYRIECAWCQQHLGWKYKHCAAPGDTSHGICPACAAAVSSQMPPLQESQDR